MHHSDQGALRPLIALTASLMLMAVLAVTEDRRGVHPASGSHALVDSQWGARRI